MRTECACGVVLVDEPAEGGVSHGLCAACLRTTLWAWLETLDPLALVGELRAAQEEVEAAAVAYGATRTRAELDEASAAYSEARGWLAMVEVEVEWRGGEV